MLVLIPAAGKSSRFPGLPPKWSLPDASGVPMIARACELLDLTEARLAVVVLQEHEELLRASAGILKALGGETEVVVLDRETKSQSETVVRALDQLSYSGAVYIKDSDNRFRLDGLNSDTNYVSVDTLNAHSRINPRNKSYVRIDDQDRILAIREKEVTSDLFSVGGYFFNDSNELVDAFEALASANIGRGEVYLSDVIERLILGGSEFRVRRVTDYEDWGTIHEWREHRMASRLILVQLDGLLFEKGSEYFAPTYHDVTPNERAVSAVVEAQQAGATVVALSVRPEGLRELTEQQLDRAGLGNLKVVYGLPDVRWQLLGAASSAVGLRHVDSVAVDPNSESLAEMIAWL